MVGLTQEQKKLFGALTQLQQEIATNTLAGMKPIDAYKASSGKAKTETARSASVSEILSKPKVIAFLESMREAAISEAIMTRQEALERLSTLARTGIADLVEFRNVEMGLDAEGNNALQAVWNVKDAILQDPAKLAAIAELSAGRDGIKIKTHSQLQAIQQLAKMEGWESAAKHEHTGPNGGPIQHQDMTDEALKQELERLGFGRGAGQLAAKMADGKQ